MAEITPMIRQGCGIAVEVAMQMSHHKDPDGYHARYNIKKGARCNRCEPEDSE